MQTVDKAMGLLGQFTVERPEYGLSDLARAAGLDKAATRRLLLALMKHEFVEQDAATRRYRLGPGFLRLTRVRQATATFESVVRPLLPRLAAETGETAHASIYADGELATVGVAQPSRPTRVHLDPAERLPLHATASGIAYLAYAPEGEAEAALARDLKRHTSATPVDRAALLRLIEAARGTGVAHAPGYYEDEVTGAAAPVLDLAGRAAGVIAVAAAGHRATPELTDRIARALSAAAREAQGALFGAR